MSAATCRTEPAFLIASAGDPAALPLSVVVPTYDRAGILDECLRALARQTLPASDFEVVVCDDGSRDDTRAVCERHARAGPLCVRYLRQENAGANAARNRAIAAARGRILLLINDDTIATPAMLALHLAAHARAPQDQVAVLGRMTVAPHLPKTRLCKLHLDFTFAQLKGKRELDWRGFYTCNVSVKKAFLAGERFEERIRYHEDLELGERLARRGLRLLYEENALGYHHHVLTEGEFLRNAQREGRALATWSRLAPHLHGELAALGFAPAQPRIARWSRAVIGLAVNRRTYALWMEIARRCPAALEHVALRIYGHVYRCEQTAALRRQLRVEAAP